jgi:hypothetical protein
MLGISIFLEYGKQYHKPIPFLPSSIALFASAAIGSWCLYA